MAGTRASGEERREQILAAAQAVARRDGIDGITLRSVAAEAGLSHGLVVFYFKGKEGLVSALLDRVLATTAILHLSDDLGGHPAPARLTAALHREVTRLVAEPQDLRLFLEYWALGVRQPAIREKIGRALDRYRSAFRSLTEGLLAEGAPHPSGITAASMAAIAVSLITGCAVQATSDPADFDTEAYVAAARALVERLAPGAA